jgi:hypothetical protein
VSGGGEPRRLFETHSHAWREVGLACQLSRRAVKRARIQAAVFVPLLVAILVVYASRAGRAPKGRHPSEKNAWRRPWASHRSAMDAACQAGAAIGAAPGRRPLEAHPWSYGARCASPRPKERFAAPNS